MGVFLSICAKTGPVYREICHCHMLTVTHAMKYMFIYFVLQLINCNVIFVLNSVSAETIISDAFSYSENV